MNTVHAPSIFNNSASASWLPICLPKFNSSGFVNAYVQFIREDDDASPKQDQSPVTPSSEASGSEDTPHKPSVEDDRIQSELSAGVGLICVSGGAEFDVIRTWGETVTKVR